VAQAILRSLLIGLIVLTTPSAGWAGHWAADADENTPAARAARREAEIRVVVAGCALLAVGLIRWGRDLAGILRRLVAARRAPAPPWQASGRPDESAPPAAWNYHPPTYEVGPPPADPAAEPKNADATVRISRRKS
jgi:hypothetical protein